MEYPAQRTTQEQSINTFTLTLKARSVRHTAMQITPLSNMQRSSSPQIDSDRTLLFDTMESACFTLDTSASDIESIFTGIQKAIGRCSHPPMDADAPRSQAEGQPRSGTPRPRRSGAATVNADTSSGRRKACNECKQQKLRCDIPGSGETTPLPVCSRCTRLGLECKIEVGFRRTRKRRRSVDLENEIRNLKKRLEEAEDGNNTNSTSETAQVRATNEIVWTLSATPGGLPPSPTATTDVTEHSRAPGLTTRPVIDEPDPRRHLSSSFPRPRALGNTALSVEEIDELFDM
ncbi:Uncharacterized protein HZ326_18277 [Fusarium oxysporum f. sp. albedinis]|nr:Uncharacterized protein HZ326_18277 [Fusarium oxysporum f. sp. albedinis]